jgi:probable phosphoglycerate mutase
VESTLVLVRHAATAWHAEGRVVGQHDLELDATGREQARGIADALAPLRVARVVSSPLRRALQTADALGARFGVAIDRDVRLTDLRVGDWEGRSPDELALRAEYWRFLADPMGAPIPGGEPLGEARDRAIAALDDASRNVTEGSVVAVTHADIIGLVLCHYLGVTLGAYLRLEVSVASVSIVAQSAGRTTVRAVNWRPTLPHALVPRTGEALGRNRRP